MDVTERIVSDLLAGEYHLLSSVERLLTHCHICGDKLAKEASDNIAISAKAGPLIFHRWCADTLRLTLMGHFLRGDEKIGGTDPE